MQCRSLHLHLQARPRPRPRAQILAWQLRWGACPRSNHARHVVSDPNRDMFLCIYLSNCALLPITMHAIICEKVKMIPTTCVCWHEVPTKATTDTANNLPSAVFFPSLKGVKPTFLPPPGAEAEAPAEAPTAAAEAGRPAEAKGGLPIPPTPTALGEPNSLRGTGLLWWAPLPASAPPDAAAPLGSESPLVVPLPRA